MASQDEQAEFIYKIGLWLRPVLDVIEKPTEFDEREKRRRRAQFAKDQQQLHNSLHEFCYKELGVSSTTEWSDIGGALGTINSHVQNFLLSDLPRLAAALDDYRRKLVSAIAAVPVSTGATTFAADTPFSTFCTLKSMMVKASKELTYVDRYVDESLFYRYLADVPTHAMVTVVTNPAAAAKPAFLDVSRLYAKERPTTYRLLEESRFHDRIAKIDDTWLLLGGSIKDAGHKSPYTVAVEQADAAKLQHLLDIINSAKELFGPSNPVHP
jgi:hypothetical protein